MPKKEFDFKIEKDRLRGHVTPEVLRDSMDGWIDDYGDVSDMIVIYNYPSTDEPGYTKLAIAFTNMTQMKLLGLLEWAKHNVISAESIEDL